LPGAPPLVLDVGCHRGSFLLPLAAQEPQHNILGIERQKERVIRTRRKIERLGLGNVWASRSGGHEALRAFANDSVAVIHVLFPDPWPKRRHSSRRLVDTKFLGECHRILKRDGLLRFVTDDPPYAWAVEKFSRDIPTLKPETNPLPAYPPSGFELTFTELEKPIHRLAWRKAGSAG
ncbi:MAG: tRNA (guanosine(46)-N7)-methyltransferase TrmB, partial [Terrimicrobiaceae bacterium]